LDWKTVKKIDMEYMQLQIKKRGRITPKIIGIDEISVRRGHKYNVIVSDIEKRIPIWFGGEDRSEKSIAEFYADLGKNRCRKLNIAAMDMWPAFETATKKHAPQASILYDKFHIIRHLNFTLDKIRRIEYGKLSGDERKYVKGQKYNLLSRWKHLELPAKRSLKTLLSNNKKLYTAYVLKETFEQLWDYAYEGSARKFFEKWKDMLKWQRLNPFKDFAKMIDRHWDGIAAYCKNSDKISLGFVEGFNNKIRVIMRRCYGLKDREYLRLKVLTCMLPELNYEN